MLVTTIGDSHLFSTEAWWLGKKLVGFESDITHLLICIRIIEAISKESHVDGAQLIKLASSPKVDVMDLFTPLPLPKYHDYVGHCKHFIHIS